MKTSFAILMVCGFIVSSTYAIPWPLGEGSSGRESIFPIKRTYGNFDEALFWIHVTSEFEDYNFHNAIDISYEDAGTEIIRAVESGIYTDCGPTDTTEVEWYAHIFPDGSTYGWHYGHVQGDDGFPLKLEEIIINRYSATYGDILGSMAEISEKHLHFFRTDQHAFHNGTTGIDNPLDYLIPEPTDANGFTWEILNSTPSVFFLPQHDAIYGM